MKKLLAVVVILLVAFAAFAVANPTPSTSVNVKVTVLPHAVLTAGQAVEWSYDPTSPVTEKNFSYSLQTNYNVKVSYNVTGTAAAFFNVPASEKFIPGSHTDLSRTVTFLPTTNFYELEAKDYNAVINITVSAAE